MIAEKHEFITLADFLKKYEGLDYERQAKQVWHAYRTTLSIDDYVIITVDSVYCMTKVHWWNGERAVIDETVKPFNSREIFPIQEIRKQFDWKY